MDVFNSCVNDLAYWWDWWDWSIETACANIFDGVEKEWVCAILLLLLSKSLIYPSNDGAMQYTLVDEEWRELKKNGKICC
jgi:hypothetical protein